jgi:hypothetical protein
LRNYSSFTTSGIFDTLLEHILFNSRMVTIPASRVRLAEVLDGDLICWNCKGRLIAGYVCLLAAAGPVPFFGEMTFACTRCSCTNRSRGAAIAGTRLEPAGEAEP